MQQNLNAMLESVVEANHKAVAAAAEFNKIATRTQGLLVRRQLAVLETCLDAGTSHLEVATQIHDPGEAMKRHSEVAVELGEKLVAAAQEALEIQVQARDAMGRWIEDGMNVVKAEAEAALGSTAAPRKTPRTAKKAA